MRTALLIGFLGIFHFLQAGKASSDTSNWWLFGLAENQLKEPAWNIVNAPSDSVKWESAFLLYHSLDSLLKLEGSQWYPFDSLKLRTLSIVNSADGKLRSYTFNVVLSNGDFKNFGFIQYQHKKSWELVTLLDTAKKYSPELIDIELDASAWHGALYYQVVPFKFNKKIHYLLVGFDGATIHSNRSLLDVFSVQEDGTPLFGAPVFRDHPNDFSEEYRVFFEYHNASVMNLRYEDRRKVVVVDQLAPAFPEATNDFRYYIPTGDYNHFAKNKKGIWVKHLGLKNYRFMKDPDVAP